MKIKTSIPLWGLLLIYTEVFAFESGSTGENGAFSPLVDTIVTLPDDGVLNYTKVDIPSGVTVTFSKNETNTPVTILASGDVTIAGIINVSGSNSSNIGHFGNGVLGDDGQPGLGGPGGFDGGRGGRPGETGGAGLGPGGGDNGVKISDDDCTNAANAGFSTNGDVVRNCSSDVRPPGSLYGTVEMLPLIGGSGGGGGYGSEFFHGSGGGGGGGAILIASSGTVTIEGSILANGGQSGWSNVDGVRQPKRYFAGGGGSGGAIRIIASTIAGNGILSAERGLGYFYGISYSSGYSYGSYGRIRLEADILTRTQASIPKASVALPGLVFVPGMPSLRISKVAGQEAPARPSGSADIILAESTGNPVTVEFATSNIPVGNTVKLRLVPAIGAPTMVESTALSGTNAAATATAAIDIPDGPGTLLAYLNYTVTANQAVALSVHTDGELVREVQLSAGIGGASMVELVTVSGRTVSVPASALAMR